MTLSEIIEETAYIAIDGIWYKLDGYTPEEFMAYFTNQDTDDTVCFTHEELKILHADFYRLDLITDNIEY